jgi:hypothetical protein
LSTIYIYRTAIVEKELEVQEVKDGDTIGKNKGGHGRAMIMLEANFGELERCIHNIVH